MNQIDYDLNKPFIAAECGADIDDDQTLLIADQVSARIGEKFVAPLISTFSYFPQGVRISGRVDALGKGGVFCLWKYFQSRQRDDHRSKVNKQS